KFHGRVSMRQALAMSLNIPAVQTLYLAGIPATIELAKRLGVTTLNDDRYYGLALALGGRAMKLLEETSAFSVFANDGIRNPATPIIKITNSSGKEIQTFTKEEIRAIDPEIARKINSILSDNAARTPIFGPNNLLHLDGYALAAKTGTTQDYRDAWTVGYTPSIAVGVWAGNNDNRPMKMGADGSYVAAPIWNKFISQIITDVPKENFIGYVPEIKNIPMISGDSRLKKKTVYYNIKTGKKISAEKAEKTDSDKIEEKVEIEDNHSLLYYLSETMHVDPEMLKRWEDAIRQYSEEEENKD
ncbi:MAG: penicillin-binding transpeptidase domain-containing protein, partial [Candidatus Moranbacteria bacterium]|nr:penicillin-binding transpeptidase domain-containing protein [Candidatus Moranbacteria bacterium]